MVASTMLKIKLCKSSIRKTKKQKAMLKALGLRKLGGIVIHKDNASIGGIVRKLSFLVKIID